MSNETKNIVSIILTDANGLAQNVERAVIILQIERRDIETCNIANTLEKLHIISDTQQNARLYRESLIFLVDGYNQDKRVLPEIPEIRRFFAVLVKEWPHWLWFLKRHMGSMAMLLSILCEVKIHREADGFGTEFENPQEVGQTLIDLLERGNAMFIAHGISESEAKESAESAVEEILGE